MRIQQRILAGVLVLGSIALLSAEAQAGGRGRRLFRGLAYAGNRNLISQPQGGPFFDENQFDQRIEWNRTGDGYTYEQFRFFGHDSYDNSNTLDLGALKIELGRDPAAVGSLQPVGVHTRVGYTQRIIPEVFFESETVQRNADIFAGTSGAAPAPVHYNITLNTGVQDYAINGNFFMQSSGRLNALGFYDLKMRVSNQGAYNADGMLLQDEKPLDFDLGPVDVSGHLLIDLISGLMENIGASGAAIPGRILSGAAQKDKELQDLLAKMDAGETLSDTELETLSQEVLKSVLTGDPLDIAANGLPSEVQVHDGLKVNFTQGDPIPTAVPETGTLALLVFGLGAMAVRPFKRWRGRPAA